MNLEEINHEIEKLKLDKESKDAFLKLMDLKIDNDMDKAITRFEAAINSLKSETNAAIGSLKESNSTIKWILTGIGAIALVILGKLFKAF